MSGVTIPLNTPVGNSVQLRIIAAIYKDRTNSAEALRLFLTNSMTRLEQMRPENIHSPVTPAPDLLLSSAIPVPTAPVVTTPPSSLAYPTVLAAALAPLLTRPLSTNIVSALTTLTQLLCSHTSPLPTVLPAATVHAHGETGEQHTPPVPHQYFTGVAPPQSP